MGDIDSSLVPIMVTDDKFIGEDAASFRDVVDACDAYHSEAQSLC